MMSLHTSVKKISQLKYASCQQFNYNQVKLKSVGLSRKFTPYTPQFPNFNIMTRRTYITGEMIATMAGILVGIGAIGGGLVTIIGRYLYSVSKNKSEKLKDYDRIIKEFQIKNNEENKKEKLEFEEFRKEYTEFQKYKQLKETINKKNEDI